METPHESGVFLFFNNGFDNERYIQLMIQQGTATTNTSGIAHVIYPVSLPSAGMFILY